MIYGESGTETLEQQSQEFNLKTTIRSFNQLKGRSTVTMRS